MKKFNRILFRPALIIVVYFSVFIYKLSQVSEKKYLPGDYKKWLVFVPGNDPVKPYYISARPVTSRKYILFMVWTRYVYCAGYPEVLTGIMPCLIAGETSADVVRMIKAPVNLSNAMKSRISYIYDNGGKNIMHNAGNLFMAFRYSRYALKRPALK
ncbi:MAG TPA: hypothetical protein VMT63_10290 [Bacteroidales bacterium]|nr:hypothetical protein [Bacteroidales bacterium]